jgi:long-chain acyl-CoA synthetase
MTRSELYANPAGCFLHHTILDSCRRHAQKTAIVDTSCGRRLTYADYGEAVESTSRGLIAAGLRPGEVIAIFLANSWEFAATFHAAQLAGAIPTTLNPSYREREVRYQLENSGAAFLVTDGSNLEGIQLGGLPGLRRVYTTRNHTSGTETFDRLRKPVSAVFPEFEKSSQETLAVLPYSSGTTGLPKGVMLSHHNLVANIYQLLGAYARDLSSADHVLCALPLYHIYGMNVVLNPVLTLGATLVLLPRFKAEQFMQLIVEESITMAPLVPPCMIALSQACEAGEFPREHGVRWAMCGAAPLSPDLARRFCSLTNILVAQGYGMTEASPATHVGFLEPELYRPSTIGQPLARTDCQVIAQFDGDLNDGPGDLTPLASGQEGELVMRGPQFMLGYWNEPEATARVLRDGWYWSGDIVSRDGEGFYRVVDRRKEMIKYKGFSIAPAEVEAVLLEHPAVKDCGVVGRSAADGGEIPVAFVALRQGFVDTGKLQSDICGFVADRLTHYKQPREVRFIEAIPKTASGKILRRELRKIV